MCDLDGVDLVAGIASGDLEPEYWDGGDCGAIVGWCDRVADDDAAVVVQDPDVGAGE